MCVGERGRGRFMYSKDPSEMCGGQAGMAEPAGQDIS